MDPLEEPLIPLEDPPERVWTRAVERALAADPMETEFLAALVPDPEEHALLGAAFMAVATGADGDDDTASGEHVARGQDDHGGFDEHPRHDALDDTGADWHDPTPGFHDDGGEW